MNKSSSFLWLILALIILLPTALGRFLLDLAGGLIIVFLGISLLLSGAIWIGWRVLQSQMKTCGNCGASLLSSANQCPICGAKINQENNIASNKDSSIPASSATIDIKAEDAEQ